MAMDPKELQTLVAMVGAVLQDTLGISDRPNYRPYVYAVKIEFADNTTVPQTGTATVQIDSQADFVCTAVRVSHRIDDTGRVVATSDQDGQGEVGGLPDVPILLQIEDGSGDRLWHSRSVDARAVYGDTSPNQGKLPRPRRIKNGSTVSFEATLLKVSASGEGHDIYIHLIGYKVYSAG